MLPHPEKTMFITIEKPMTLGETQQLTRHFLTEDYQTEDGYSLQKGQELLIIAGDDEGVVCDIVIDYDRLGDWQTKIPNHLVEKRTFEIRLIDTRRIDS